MNPPLHAWLILLSPGRIVAGLSRVAERGLVPTVPTLWQIELGVLRMWHRLVFRSETIGTCSVDAVRPGWRSRLLSWRVLRFPFLMWERAIAPWDMSGLLSSPERIIRHLLGAHHDGDQFLYDFHLLDLHPGAVASLHRQTAAVVSGTSTEGEWLRDLTVFEGYHERLLAAVEGFVADEPMPAVAASDPDLTFTAWLRWCAAQPESPSATLRAWREGVFDLQHGWQRA